LVHDVLQGGSPQAEHVKMRALGSPTPAALPDIEVHADPDTDLSVMLSFGLAASLGLAAFASVQYGRLRRALQRQREAEMHSRQLALHDQLTGLANRRNFEEFGQRVTFERPVAERRAVFLIDLDHFKTVNDVHGHAAGDKALVDYAARIQDHFPGGMVARFGGDEFAVITPPLKENSEALHYARYCIAGVSEPFDYHGVALALGASVGVAMIGDGERSIADALRRADIALYKAKRGGRMQIAFFEDTLEQIVLERNWIETELRAALASGGIVPHFQPVIDLATREIVGYEALARWTHAERGIINPAAFIPVAEECGLISQLGECILAQSLAIARHWPAHVTLSVNLSPVQLRDKGLCRKVLDMLAAADFPASRLEVEITENALISDLETARATIVALRAAGVSVALDDFGTGHSTLNHLTVCHFDRLKIDRSFVSSLGDNHDSRRIVDAILNLSRSFGIRCTAEGIENQGELQMLSDWGCREGQGYLFGRPDVTTRFDRPQSASDAERRTA
jgi:diguanylate cyclase (GGDEF)-like protein